MAHAMIITTEMRFDGNQTESFFDGHPAIMLDGLTGVAENSDVWSPPHLFVAAVESCFFLTLQSVAERMKVEIATYSSSATAELVSPDGKHKEIQEIVIRPKIMFTNDSDRAKIPQLTKLAEEYCLVARSLKSKVRIEGETAATA